jgi:hypothetical protein
MASVRPRPSKTATSNGLGHVMPDDDEELADHIVGYGEGTHGMEDTAAMLEQRVNGAQSSHAAFQ